eukprot:9241266-Alexandrium_andersonii.AAC.1
MISPLLPNVDLGRHVAAGGVPAFGEDGDDPGQHMAAGGKPALGKSHKAQAARAHMAAGGVPSPE